MSEAEPPAEAEQSELPAEPEGPLPGVRTLEERAQDEDQEEPGQAERQEEPAAEDEEERAQAEGQEEPAAEDVTGTEVGQPEPAGQAEPAAPMGGQAEPAGGQAEPLAGQAETREDDVVSLEDGLPVAEEPVAPPELVEVALSEVRPSVMLRPGQEAGLVVLAEMDEPFRSLHIYVGQAEAKAIQAGWHGGRPARPGTWDLLLQAVELLGARVEKVIIDNVEEARHFFATVDLEREGQTYSLSCRPSDAIALAVRTPAAGLFTTEDVLAAAGQYP